MTVCRVDFSLPKKLDCHVAYAPRNDKKLTCHSERRIDLRVSGPLNPLPNF
ncbi:hypothetical protein J6E39_08175 [bacterium]|nr:hypothetical protein [bacterium]